MTLLLFILKEVLTEFTFGWYMSKDDQLASWAILIWLIKKVFFKFFLLYIKNEWEKLLSKEQRCITKYYGTGKERFTEHARDKYRNFSEEEKNKQREYRKNRYHNISETKTKRISKQIIVRLKSLNEKSVK